MQMQSVRRVLLQPDAMLEIDGQGGSIALVDSELPRVVVRCNSHAFDLREGNCLPLDAAKAQIINPYGRAGYVQISQGGPIKYSWTDNRSGGKHAERVNYVSRLLTNAADPLKRVGVGFMARRGRFLLTINHPNSINNLFRVTVLNGASSQFLASKPIGFMTETLSIVDWQNKPTDRLFGVGGYFTDLDVGAWIAGSGYAGSADVYESQMFSQSQQRWVIDDRTAVFISRVENTSFHDFRFHLEDMGAPAQEWY